MNGSPIPQNFMLRPFPPMYIFKKIEETSYI
jgi:hypothetical protein